MYHVSHLGQSYPHLSHLSPLTVTATTHSQISHLSNNYDLTPHVSVTVTSHSNISRPTSQSQSHLTFIVTTHSNISRPTSQSQSHLTFIVTTHSNISQLTVTSHIHNSRSHAHVRLSPSHISHSVTTHSNISLLKVTYHSHMSVSLSQSHLALSVSSHSPYILASYYNTETFKTKSASLLITGARKYNHITLLLHNCQWLLIDERVQ